MPFAVWFSSNGCKFSPLLQSVIAPFFEHPGCDVWVEQQWCWLRCSLLLVSAKGTVSSGCGVHVLAMSCISRMPSRVAE